MPDGVTGAQNAHLASKKFGLFSLWQMPTKSRRRIFLMLMIKIYQNTTTYFTIKRKKKMHLESIFDRLPLYKLMATSEVQESWNKWKIGSKY